MSGPDLPDVVEKHSYVSRHEKNRPEMPVIPDRNDFYWFMRRIIRGINKAYLGFEVIGAENLPETGGVLVVPNHASNLDPTTIAAGLNREVHFLAKEELFTGALGKFLPKVNAHPLKRSGIDRAAIRMCREILQQGHVLMLFPEGQRTKTGELLDPKPGAALIAAQANVPLVPAYISGTLESMPTGAKFAKPGKVRVFYGKPFELEHIDEVRMPKKDFYDKAGKLIMEKIGELEKQAREYKA